MSHVKRKHDNVYAPPTLRIQLQIWPIVASITELTMHTELKCSKSLSLSVSLLFANFGCQQLRMRTCTHQYTGAHVLIGMHKLHMHTHGMHELRMHAHSHTYTGMHACMHTHTHRSPPAFGHSGLMQANVTGRGIQKESECQTRTRTHTHVKVTTTYQDKKQCLLSTHF
eukprot:scpid18962/ scgid13872/ 